MTAKKILIIINVIWFIMFLVLVACGFIAIIKYSAYIMALIAWATAFYLFYIIYSSTKKEKSDNE